MITSVHLQEFKGHRDTHIPLGRFSVLVGPNGSGKTSVLEALWLQSEIVRRNSRAVFSGDWSLNAVRRRKLEGPLILASEGESSEGKWDVSFSISDAQHPLALKWTHFDVEHECRMTP